MRINTYRSKLFLFYFLSIFFFAVLVSTRDLHIGGTDPFVYKRYFEKMEFYAHGDRRFEIGYHLFNYYIRKLTENYHFFLIIFYTTFNLIYFKSMVDFSDLKSKTSYLLSTLLFLGLSLNSSWYISATTNGLRQGFSLALLYLALSYLPYNTKTGKIKFLLIIILSLSFHDSTILVAPFLLLLLAPLRLVILTFFALSVFYPLGLNEAIVFYLSNFTGLPIHFEIASYADNLSKASWVGFQLDFFIYSTFWNLLFIFLHFKFFRYNMKSEYLLKVLMVLTSTYFFYGFGAFSNRFGFISWLFLPIIQTFYLTNLMTSKTKDVHIVFLVFSLILVTGFVNYYLLLRPII